MRCDGRIWQVHTYRSWVVWLFFWIRLMPFTCDDLRDWVRMLPLEGFISTK